MTSATARRIRRRRRRYGPRRYPPGEVSHEQLKREVAAGYEFFLRAKPGRLPA